MTTNQKIGTVAAIVLVLLTVAARMSGMSAPDEAWVDRMTAAPAIDAEDPDGMDDTERRHVDPVDAAVTAGSDASPAALGLQAAPSPTTPVPPRERIPFVVLRHVPPRPVPEGYTELAPGEDPVIPDSGAAIGEGASGPRLLPYWSRWAPTPPKGTVELHGRVTDAAGRGLEGAQVYRVRLDEQGRRASPSSYQWITEIAVTDAEGAYVARDQPPGDFLIAADYRATMRTRRGLDIRTALPINITSMQRMSRVNVQLPIESARLSSVRFVVQDENGRPMRNAEIMAPLERLRTDAAGLATLGGLQPGLTPVKVGRTGYATQTIEIDVQPGSENEVVVRLDFAEKGDLILEGRVVDEDGTPVADAPIFVAAGRQGSRRTRTGADGVFRIEYMDRKYAQQAVRVMVSPHPEHDRFKPLGAPIETKVPSPGLELRVQRTAKLHVLIRDEETGDPLPLYAIESQLLTVTDGREEWRNHHGMSRHDVAGEAVFMVPQGRIRLTVRAKDHRGVEIGVDVPDALSDREILVELKRE